MKAVLLVFTALAWGMSAFADNLVPDARITLDFPELPNTLAGMFEGKTAVAELGAILPGNYTRDAQASALRVSQS